MKDESLSSLKPTPGVIVDQHCILSSLNVHQKPTYFMELGSVTRGEGRCPIKYLMTKSFQPTSIIGVDAAMSVELRPTGEEASGGSKT